jgi:hypothetical protein
VADNIMHGDFGFFLSILPWAGANSRMHTHGGHWTLAVWYQIVTGC